MEATHSLINENLTVADQPHRTHISIEWAAYVALIVLAFVLRIAELDTVPMTTAESREALAAWRVVQASSVTDPVVHSSPILFMLHSLAFTTLGSSEFAARIGTVLGSIALLLTPVLFRGLLGRGRASILSTFLTFSPTLLIASRTDSPTVWALLFGVLALWAWWRYYESAQRAYAAAGVVLTACVIFLTTSTGLVFTLVLSGALLFATWLTPRRSYEDSEEPPPENRFSIVRERLQTFPWLNSLLLSGLVVGIISTLFMLYPAGLNGVSNLLGLGVGGFTRPLPGIPGAFPVLVSLFYEPLTVILGVIAIIWLIRRDQFTFVERFFTGWLLLGIVATVFYAGASAEQSLWLVLPLTGLASALVYGLLAPSTHPLWWNVPAWSKWIVAIIAIFLIAMFAIHLQSLARTMLNSPGGVLQPGDANSASVVLVIISLMSILIGVFLAASIWGMETTMQGVVLGLLAFGLTTSLASGWRAAVEIADDPAELWNREATSSDTTLLRNTLSEIANRVSEGFPQMPLSVLAPSDGIVAWLVRDYPNARFITDPRDAEAREIVLLPLYNEPPNLGANYVGQSFRVRSTWNPAVITPSSFLAWWTSRNTRVPAESSETMVLWLRQDVYDGVPAETNTENG